MTTEPVGIVGVFDRAADTYDAVGVPWFGPIADGLVAELAPRPGERALDIGCGRGAVTRPLAQAVGANGTVLAVDLAPQMVAKTAQDFADLPQVSVQVGDAAALDVPGDWDLIASSLVLFFLPDPAGAATSWVQLLRPGGRLGVTTFGAATTTATGAGAAAAGGAVEVMTIGTATSLTVGARVGAIAMLI